MTLTQFRKILADDTTSTEQFLRVHCCVEELFRRLLLIGLKDLMAFENFIPEFRLFSGALQRQKIMRLRTKFYPAVQGFNRQAG